MMRQAARWVGVAVGALVLVGCIAKYRKSSKLTLASARQDVATLERQLRANNVDRPQLFIEAYLAHFSGRIPTRDRALCAWFRVTGLTAARARARLALFQSPSTLRMKHFLTALRSLGRCAPQKHSNPSEHFLPGMYTFSETKSSLAGDTLHVRERWLIRRDGPRLWGWYLRRLERTSGDGRAYRYSRAPHYSVLMAFKFEGKVIGRSLSLVETDAFIRPGPCAPKKVRLDRCSGAAHGQQFVLNCPRKVRLRRVSSSPGRPDVATGVFRQIRSVQRSDGGHQWVEMDLHLSHRKEQILGWISRATTARKGKSFACNGRRRFSLNTMVVVVGTIKAGTIALREVMALHRPGPCDNGKVELKTYSGSLSGSTLRLRWRDGTQTYKRRPGVTTPALSLGPMKRRWFER